MPASPRAKLCPVVLNTISSNIKLRDREAGFSRGRKGDGETS